MKFLILRFSSIGDIVLTTPVIRCLSKQLDHAEIHVVVKASFKPVLEHNPYIAQLHILENDLTKTTRSLAAIGFDQIIDLHGNLRTLRIKQGLQLPHRTFRKLNLEKWLLTNFKINRLPQLHIVDRYMETVLPFGVVNDGAGLDYFLSAADTVPDDSLPLPHRGGYVGIAVGAAHATKRLPLQKLVEIVENIDHPIVLLGGNEDQKVSRPLAETFGDKVYDACGRYTLNQSAFLVKKARVMLTNDTGLMHIAAAFKKPTVSVWGNTIPGFGMTPYYGKTMVEAPIFEIPDLPCRPCSKIGFDRCPKKHFKCMMDQPSLQIARTVNALFHKESFY